MKYLLYIYICEYTGIRPFEAMNYPLTVLLSFFSGLLSELIAWVMLFHQLSPKNHG